MPPLRGHHSISSSIFSDPIAIGLSEHQRNLSLSNITMSRSRKFAVTMCKNSNKPQENFTTNFLFLRFFNANQKLSVNRTLKKRRKLQQKTITWIQRRENHSTELVEINLSRNRIIEQCGGVAEDLWNRSVAVDKKNLLSKSMDLLCHTLFLYIFSFYNPRNFP